MSAPGDAMITREAFERHVAELVRQGLLLVVGKRRGRCTYQWRPGASEWVEAVEAYTRARDDGAVTEAHPERVRATWRVINDQVELDSDQEALMDEVMRFQ
jgi:hypothetical protein